MLYINDMNLHKQKHGDIATLCVFTASVACTSSSSTVNNSFIFWRITRLKKRKEKAEKKGTFKIYLKKIND